MQLDQVFRAKPGEWVPDKIESKLWNRALMNIRED